MDFGDLKDDKPVQEKLTNFHNSINKVQKILETALDNEVYEKLDVKEKVDYDLFISYTLNTLYWSYLRSKGADPNTNDVKNQLNRVKEYMVKAKQAHDRNTVRPKLDKPAANRFIKHGLNHNDDEERPNKKIRFD